YVEQQRYLTRFARLAQEADRGTVFLGRDLVLLDELFDGHDEIFEDRGESCIRHSRASAPEPTSAPPRPGDTGDPCTSRRGWSARRSLTNSPCRAKREGRNGSAPSGATEDVPSSDRQRAGPRGWAVVSRR